MNPTHHRWRDLWAHEKLIVAFEAARRAGGFAFSLNLSDRLEKSLWQLGHPVNRFSDYIGREMRAALGVIPPYAFAFELEPASGRLHVHGVIVADASDAVQLQQMHRALKRAAGVMNGRAAAWQLKLKPLFDGLGWAGYSVKTLEQTSGYLGTSKASFVSTALKRQARQIHTTLK